MKLYFVFSIFVLFYISVVRGQTVPDELSPECKGIREKLEKNMAIIENTANTAQMIQQRDCNFAKNSVKLTKKYNKCLPRNGQQGMDNVLKNMRFVSKMICENVNKRILGCFSPENLRQFNRCTNKTIQYMDFIAKQERKKTETTDLSKPQVRRKRFLFQDFLSGISDGIQGTIQSGIQTGSGFLGGGLLKRNMKADKFGSTTNYEWRCCQLHMKSECFVNKVLHTCADKSELRIAKALQTVLSLAVKDVVEIACGKIQTLDQCEKFSNDWDVEEDLGF